MLTLTHTSFKSGYLHDMKRLTAAAHAVGALVIWDLSHSVGVMPVALGDCGVDLAVGYCYKFSQRWAGSAGVSVCSARAPGGDFPAPVWGWFGRRTRFSSALPILRQTASIDFWSERPPFSRCRQSNLAWIFCSKPVWRAFRRKSILQTSLLVALWEEHLAPQGVSLNSPRDSDVRGGHVSFGHPEALRIDQALISQKKVVPETFAAPTTSASAPRHCTTRFLSWSRRILRMRDMIESGVFREFPAELPGVS